MLRSGSHVVYCKTKHSTHPGPRARNVSPSRHGDAYSYCVEKFWLVEKYIAQEKIVVVTRRGKRREVDINDPNLRPATLFDRIRYWGRFPKAQILSRPENQD